MQGHGRAAMLAIVILTLFACAQAHATLLWTATYLGDDRVNEGDPWQEWPRYAKAQFKAYDDGTLKLQLANIAFPDVLAPNQVLTAVAFDIYKGTELLTTGLTPVSAFLSDGSVVHFPPEGTDGETNMGGEWAYAGELTSMPGDAWHGVSSTGLGNIFGDANFNGPNLQHPTAVDGLNYGITAEFDDLTSGNNAVTGKTTSGKNNGKVFPLIQYSVDFALTGWDSDWTLNNVWFQYGTSLDEPSNEYTEVIYGSGGIIPEPTSLALLAVAIGGVAVGVRRRRVK